MKITRVSLKSEAKVTIPFAKNDKDWMSYPFAATHQVEFSNVMNLHTADHPERITPRVNGECLVMAKYNFRDIVSAGAVSVATRFGRMKEGDAELDITWTNELAAGAMTAGLWCHTANGPQKSMVKDQFWVTQLRVSGPQGGSVVVETAEFILTGWHD